MHPLLLVAVFFCQSLMLDARQDSAVLCRSICLLLEACTVGHSYSLCDCSTPAYVPCGHATTAGGRGGGNLCVCSFPLFHLHCAVRWWLVAVTRAFLVLGVAPTKKRVQRVGLCSCFCCSQHPSLVSQTQSLHALTSSGEESTSIGQ